MKSNLSRHSFYPRWKEWEIQQALELDYTLDESQLTEDWAEILSLASQPGASLEQIHIFCLAHVLRRPIIVYGVKYVKSWRGENLGYARFEGMYHTFINLTYLQKLKKFLSLTANINYITILYFRSVSAIIMGAILLYKISYFFGIYSRPFLCLGTT